jgi:hypothetical protein
MLDQIIVNRYECSIPPEPFQIVKGPCFSLENVHNDVDVVEQNPREGPESFRVPQRHSDLLGAVTDSIGDRFDLSIGIGGANYKEISGGAQLAEVQQNDIRRLLGDREISDLFRQSP